MTWIAAAVFINDDVPAMLNLIQECAVQGADMIELRCDTCSKQAMETVLRDPAVRQLRLLVTIRPPWEGGRFAGSESDRLELMVAACRLKPDFVDIELEAWKNNPKFPQRLLPLLARPSLEDASAGAKRLPGPQLVISSHDFSGRPPDLDGRFAALASVQEAAVLKLSYKANNSLDALEALALYPKLTEKYRRPLVVIAMGEDGQISRFLSAKFGAAFTFATPNHSAGTAPGQPRIGDLVNVYRFRQQALHWGVYGVIGWPVAHSISPIIHNAAFTHIGFDAVYVPMLVAPGYDNFAAFIDAARKCPQLNLQGLSITIPHKENALEYVRRNGGEIDPTSKAIGVVNTIFLNTNPIQGINSDWTGAIKAMEIVGGIGKKEFKQRAAVVIGAGGAARSIVAGLASLDANVTVFNRTLDRAKTLAQQFNGKTGRVQAAPFEQIGREKFDLLINCTSVGMYPDSSGLPIPETLNFAPGQIVFDTVYNPRQTRLLKLAQSRGAIAVPGLEMLLHQAEVQFSGFAKTKAPMEIMHAAAESALAAMGQ